MAYEATVVELRAGLDIAHTLAKARVGFVVVPAYDREDFQRLMLDAAFRLDAVAGEAESLSTSRQETSHAD